MDHLVTKSQEFQKITTREQADKFFKHCRTEQAIEMRLELVLRRNDVRINLACHKRMRADLEKQPQIVKDFAEAALSRIVTMRADAERTAAENEMALLLGEME